MAKKSEQSDSAEQSAATAVPAATSRMNGWAIAGIAAAAALLISGSAAAGAVAGVSLVSQEGHDGPRQMQGMNADGNFSGPDWDDDRDEYDHPEFGDRDGTGDHRGDRGDRDELQRQQGPGMPDQQAPQQPAPDAQPNVTP